MIKEVVNYAIHNEQHSELIEEMQDNRTLEEIIQEIANEEGMTVDETMALFKKGLKDANNMLKPIDYKAKTKKKSKRKQAKQSRKNNR